MHGVGENIELGVKFNGFNLNNVLSLLEVRHRSNGSSNFEAEGSELLQFYATGSTGCCLTPKHLVTCCIHCTCSCAQNARAQSESHTSYVEGASACHSHHSKPNSIQMFTRCAPTCHSTAHTSRVPAWQACCVLLTSLTYSMHRQLEYIPDRLRRLLSVQWQCTINKGFIPAGRRAINIFELSKTI